MTAEFERREVLSREIYELRLTVSAMKDREERTEAEMVNMRRDIDSLKQSASHWKGGFFVIVAIGGVVTWLSTVGSNIIKAFK